MTAREQFEAWMKERFADSDTTGFGPVMFVAWQASRTAALEEAAIAAWSAGMDEYGQYSQLMDPRHVGAVCAKRIRALAKGDGE